MFGAISCLMAYDRDDDLAVDRHFEVGGRYSSFESREFARDVLFPLF